MGFVLALSQAAFADTEGADALNLLQVHVDKHSTNHQCAPKLLAAKSGMLPADLDLAGAGGGNVDQCAAKCGKLGSKYFQLGPKCICAKPSVTDEPDHPPNARWTVYSVDCGGSGEPAEEEKCVPELYSKLNGMIPAILNYDTFLKTRSVSLEQCEKHCRDAGSYYFEIGTAGRVHSGNCICAKAGIAPPTPDGNANWNIYTTCSEPETGTADTGEVCKHYETQDSCPSPRCNWDGDSCADPPCSSYTSKDGCCGDCAWEGGKCQPAMFKACPKEGTPGSNVCPEGCTFVDSCEQCEFAAGVWEKDFSTEPWPPSSGSRPQGCFRNRKFNIKCNKFEPGSKYSSGVGKVGEKRGKWPICKVIEPPKVC